MDKFEIDIRSLIKDDINRESYTYLLMFCVFDKEYKTNPSKLGDKSFLRDLYQRFHFKGVQREKNEDLEYSEFISAYYTLDETIRDFYKLKYHHQEIIQDNIATMNDRVKPFKTGLLDFCKYINLYLIIHKFELDDSIDTITKNKKLFVVLLNYDKDILATYRDLVCKKDLTTYIEHYTKSQQPLLWILQAIISTKNPESFNCVDYIMTNLFSLNLYYDEEFKAVFKKIFTFNVVDQYAKLFRMYLDIFFSKYDETIIFDIDTNECKKKDSHVHRCANTEFIICNDMDVDIKFYCK